MADESDIHPQNLASAIVHWLELEHLFKRAPLLNEASLKMPIHQFLASNVSLELHLEVSFPGLPSSQGQALDFCLKRWKTKSSSAPGLPTAPAAATTAPAAATTALAAATTALAAATTAPAAATTAPAAATTAPAAATTAPSVAWLHVIESKFITDKRSFQQEIFDDLLRLEFTELAGQTERPCRWLLLAGRKTHMTSQIFDVETNPGQKGHRVKTFEEILTQTLGDKKHIHVAEETRSGFKAKWTKSAKDINLTQWPVSFDVKLCGKQETTNFACYIWRVLRVSNRALRTI